MQSEAPQVSESARRPPKSLSYSGWGKATFTNPPGEIEGPATVRFCRSGRHKVVIDVERGPDPSSGFSYFKGLAPATDYMLSGLANPCSRVTVSSDQGTFISDERVILLQEDQSRVRLMPLRSRFVAAASGPAASWAIPLTNFVHPHVVSQASSERVFRRLLKEANPDGPRMATAAARERRFDFVVGGRPGFIELPAGYSKLVRRLTKRRCRSAFTAVAVGPAHVDAVGFSDPGSVFPIDVLAVLTLATGVRIGAPWVEFYDAAGRLVRRDHIPFGAPAYVRGRPAVAEYGPEAIGPMLSALFAADERGKNYLRAALHQTIDASFRGTLENRFLTLVRAIETLCKQFSLDSSDLMAELDGQQRVAVEAALRLAEASITRLTVGEASAGPRAALARIAQRAAAAGHRENAFGLKVLGLMRRFAFPDADVLQPLLAAHPVAGIDNWPGLLSYLRGAVSHEAYFDVPGDRYDCQDVLKVPDHLNDVVLRVLFKTLGYAGPYRSPIPPRAHVESVDWVTAATPPWLLGY